MEPMEIRMWNSKVNMLEKTEEIIEESNITRHDQKTFFEGLALFFAEGYKNSAATDRSYGMLSQRVA